jgi:hypothetical protein
MQPRGSLRLRASQSLVRTYGGPYIETRTHTFLRKDFAYRINSIEPRFMHSYLVELLRAATHHRLSSRRRREIMLAIAVIVIIAVVLLISMDRVSGRQTTNGRSLKEAEDRFLNRFLHRRFQRRPKR